MLSDFPSVLKLIIIIVFLMSLCFLSAGIYLLIYRKLMGRDKLVKVDAVIVDVKEDDSTDFYTPGDSYMRIITYYPVYRYIYEDKEYEVIGKVGGMKNYYKIGQKVIAYIDKDTKKLYKTDIEDPVANKISFIFILVGLLLLAAAIITLVISYTIFK